MVSALLFLAQDERVKLVAKTTNKRNLSHETSAQGKHTLSFGLNFKAQPKNKKTNIEKQIGHGKLRARNYRPDLQDTGSTVTSPGKDCHPAPYIHGRAPPRPRPQPHTTAAKKSLRRIPVIPQHFRQRGYRGRLTQRQQDPISWHKMKHASSFAGLSA